MARSTRIEIFRSGLWRELRLQNEGAVKYNRVINRIGNIENREISHTNTFSLPYVDQNIQALGINVFNPSVMALALNSKHIARYYVDDKLLQQGYLVINNTYDGVINVNFIDEGLDIVEKWGSITYRQLLEDGASLSIPADYQAAIAEMTDYDMDKTSTLTPLSQVGSRGYNLALFPNNLNTIGDEFQIDDAGERNGNNQFNPYQSRPIFNARALMDLACEAYGYTPIYDTSIDWSRVEASYMNKSQLNDNLFDEGGLSEIVQPTNSVSFYYYKSTTPFPGPNDYYTTVNHATVVDAARPMDISNWVDPPGWLSSGAGVNTGGYTTQRCVYKPRISESVLGTIDFTYSKVVAGNPSGGFHYRDSLIAWEGTGASPSVKFTTLNYQTIITDTDQIFDAVINKSVFDPSNAPANSSGKAIGFMVQVRITGVTNTYDFLVQNTNLTETYVPGGVIAYDEYGQYISNSVTLTYAAPDETMKKLIAAIMKEEGILMNIDNKAKEITFFSYGKYQTRKENDEFVDWSKLLLRYRPPSYNTDYGNNYARLNALGLASPYTGNIAYIPLSNQGVESKYKDFAQNYSKLFKDVVSITNVQNTTTPYFEYENLGLGLTAYTGTLGSLTQVRADGSQQGSFSGLAAIANQNYGLAPTGVQEWYKLIDEAVRVETMFLLPVTQVGDFDLSVPVYVEELGGFYIIEEIAEYSNAQTPVRVKLIKLIDNLISL